ncbi:MAG: hypothetical protein ACD_23C01218G0002 [uncultured bacterium]|nr:MAG: hypothetical protein ACD_23C01218G0002 [uncultured bacterium]
MELHRKIVQPLRPSRPTSLGSTGFMHVQVFRPIKRAGEAGSQLRAGGRDEQSAAQCAHARAASNHPSTMGAVSPERQIDLRPFLFDLKAVAKTAMYQMAPRAPILPSIDFHRRYPPD